MKNVQKVEIDNDFEIILDSTLIFSNIQIISFKGYLQL